MLVWLKISCVFVFWVCIYYRTKCFFVTIGSLYLHAVGVLASNVHLNGTFGIGPLIDGFTNFLSNDCQSMVALAGIYFLNVENLTSFILHGLSRKETR